MIQDSSNKKLAFSLMGFVGLMVAISFAAVPLYRVFCQATGFGGTPRIDGSPAPGGQQNNTFIVRFDANTSPKLFWKFTADNREQIVGLGEESIATYTGTSFANHVTEGVATYNIVPEKAAKYFHKTACFCFDQQTLEAGQTVSFPLSFWIDPAIRMDAETRDLHSVTMSYTFFRSINDATGSDGLSRLGPHVGRTSIQAKAAKD